MKANPRRAEIAQHKLWMDAIQHEYPMPYTPYKIGVYIRYYNQTKYEDYLTKHKQQFVDDIARCPKWTLVDFYIDEGAVAPRMENAKEWCRLLDDCLSGKVDLIVTQKVSNVSSDWRELNFVARILATQKRPIGIYFISDDVFTLASYYRFNMKDEAYLMLSIPIKPWMHLVSKLICSLIWVTASRICKYIVSMVMAAAAGEDVNHMNSSFAMLFGEQMNTKKILIWNFCMELLLVITIQLFTYLVSIISAKSAKHRRGLSVAYTIGGTVLMSWGFGAVLMFYFKYIAPESRVSNVADGLITVYIPSIIYLAVLSVAFYTASALILTKKFDLL